MALASVKKAVMNVPGAGRRRGLRDLVILALFLALVAASRYLGWLPLSVAE
jgi:hypothetical protein